MKPRLLNTTNEHLLLAAVALAAYLISSQLDLFELLVSFAIRYEAYEVDELLIVSVVMVFCQAILLRRRWKTLVQAKTKLDDRHEELKNAMAEIRQLKGIIPICASCKKIRDDDGYWHQVEAYLRTHSGAQFSHGLCPSCMKEFYGDILDDKS